MSPEDYEQEIEKLEAKIEKDKAALSEYFRQWEQDKETIKRFQAENKELREALKAIMTNPSINLGDRIYDVKDREGKGWDGPDVIAWGRAVVSARKLLEP